MEEGRVSGCEEGYASVWGGGVIPGCVGRSIAQRRCVWVFMGRFVGWVGVRRYVCGE